MKNKILYLESLRGLAAILVALFHFRDSSKSLIIDNQFIQNGWVMVDFFFVLSGFVIAYTYSEKILSFRNLINFQIRRFLRLYPLHLFTLFLMLGLEFLQLIKEFITKQTGEGAAFSYNDPISFFHNIFLTQAIFNNKLTFNNPSWSISTEFITYFIYAIIILFIKNTKYILIISLMIILFSGYFIFNELNVVNEFAILRCIHSFFLGTIASYIFKNTNIKINNIISYGFFLLTIISIFFLKSLPPIIFPIIFLFLILTLLKSEDNIMKQFLSHKILIFFGKISYGIYMTHYFVWVSIQQILIITKIGNYNSDYILNPFLGTIVLIIGMIIIFFLSNFLYKNLEIPFNNLRKKL